MRMFSALVVTIVIGLVGCGGGGPAADQPTEAPEPVDKLIVYTVNYPLAYFAERVGGDLVEVHFPAPSEGDPAMWSPDADTIATYQVADLILVNGAGYAKWVERATLPSAKLVDTTAGAADRLLELESQVTHSHGPEGEHEHAGWAFTTWMDPTIAVEQARAVADAIASRRPDQASEIMQRFAELENDLLDLDRRLEAAAQSIGDSPLVFSHPVYQYLIARYGLKGEEIHWEPDVVPTGHDWEHLDELLAGHPAQWMVWEAEPLDDSVAALHERAIDSIVFDPCGNRPDNGDFMSVMTENAEALERIAQ